MFSSLASLGAKVLPFAIKGVSKLAPALATGAATALGDIGIKKLFGGQLPFITIPKKFIKMLAPFKKEFTKSQRDSINKAYQTGGKLVIRPTVKQIEGGFLGTLASIGIPMAISLVSKMLGSGLQVDRGAASNTRNVYVPPVATFGDGYIYQPPPFNGSWSNPEIIGMGKGKKKTKKKVKRKRNTSGKRQPIQLDSHSGNNSINKKFVIKPLSNFDLIDWIKKLGIKHLKGIYSRDGLPREIKKECGIINLDDIQGPGTHWVCYRNINNVVEYFDPFGLIMPNEALKYFKTANKPIVYSIDEIQNRSTVLCGYWCLYYLLERQKGKSILDVIHNPHFDNDNSDFIKKWFGDLK